MDVSDITLGAILSKQHGVSYKTLMAVSVAQKKKQQKTHSCDFATQ